MYYSYMVRTDYVGSAGKEVSVNFRKVTLTLLSRQVTALLYQANFFTEVEFYVRKNILKSKLKV